MAVRCDGRYLSRHVVPSGRPDGWPGTRHYRLQLVGDRSRETVRMELMLEDASTKLSTVASSLNTVSAQGDADGDDRRRDQRFSWLTWRRVGCGRRSGTPVGGQLKVPNCASLHWTWRSPSAAKQKRSPGSYCAPIRASEYTADRFRTACDRMGRSRSHRLRPDGDSAVDGPGRVGAGQCGHRILAFHPRARACAPSCISPLRAEARTAVAAWIDDHDRHRRHPACRCDPRSTSS
jgi:hypothetical protein